MPGIVFYFENNDVDVWSGRKIDLDAWNYAVKAAGDIDKVIAINKTNEKLNFDADFDFKIVSKFPKLKGKIATICCPWDIADEKIALWDFNHVVDWYIFGPAAGWKDHINGLGIYVPISGQGALHSVHIASIVLTHRYGVITWQ